METRTYCGTIDKSSVGQVVIMMGWSWRWRDHGGVVFIDLRDRSGQCQIVFNPEKAPEIHDLARQLRSEYVIKVTGTVQERDEININPKIPTGEVEVMASELVILSKSDALPFVIEDETDVGEDMRLKYRYLDLRRPVMQKYMMNRAKAYQITREYMYEQGFLEIETPVLTKSTPEGARDYLVPSRLYHGQFYALPQSPQIYKQLLMVSGFDRYFQIVKCFRDEDLRANRQPEFTQIDIEMSFAKPDNFFPIIEGLTKKIFDKFFEEKIELPFKRMCYKEAISRFGIDRPDTRFGLELVEVSEIAGASDFKVFKSVIEKKGMICGINLKECGAKFSRKEIDDLADITAIYGAKGLAWMKVTESGLESNIVKFFSEDIQAQLKEKMAAEPGDLLVFVADKPKIVYDSLANLRLAMGKKLGLIDKNRRDFLWIVDFPLFEEDDKGNPSPMHHPFTSPVPEDIPKMDENPLELRAQAYDLVLNGEEIAGGSIRIHQRDVQKKIFDLIGISPEEAQSRFGFLLEAFKYGPPPHGGIAFGFDRLMMLINGTSSIRDVIAFPKTQRAQALMEEAPTDVSDDQLKELGIKVR